MKNGAPRNQFISACKFLNGSYVKLMQLYNTAQLIDVFITKLITAYN